MISTVLKYAKVSHSNDRERKVSLELGVKYLISTLQCMINKEIFVNLQVFFMNNICLDLFV